MTINWEKGEINDDQVILGPESVFATVETMPVESDGYVQLSNIGVTQDGHMWLDLEGILIPRHLVSEEQETSDLCRVIKLREGVIVDLSRSVIDLREGGKAKFVPTKEIEYEEEFWAPVIEIINTEEQRERLEQILFSKAIFIGSTLLSEISN